MVKQKTINTHTTAHAEELSRLAKVGGQLAGIEKMISNERGSPEIIQQLRAATSAIKALELMYIKRHISSTIKASVKSDTPAVFDRKLKELVGLIRI